MVAIYTVRDSGQNPRILWVILNRRKKDGASKGVLDPIPPDNRPRDFAIHLKKRASLAVQIHFFLARSLVKVVSWSQQVGVAASTIKR